MMVIPEANCPNSSRRALPSSCAVAVSVMFLLESNREVVAPQAHRGALPRDPVVVVDLQPLAPELQVEAAGRLHVEGQHLVVDMPAERRRHLYLATIRPVQSQSHIIGVLHLARKSVV